MSESASRTRETPRTDALLDTAGTEHNITQLAAKFNAMLEHARVLERESDGKDAEVQLYREQYHDAVVRLAETEGKLDRAIDAYAEEHGRAAEMAASIRSESAFTQGDAHPCDISRSVREQTIEQCAKVLGERLDSLRIMADRAGYTREGSDLSQRASEMYDAIKRIQALKLPSTERTRDV